MSIVTLDKLPAHIAESLLKIGAVSLKPKDPFTWSSGMKSPIYCDNRLTMGYPDIRESIAEGFSTLIRAHYPDAEVIAGIATGGIPHAAWTAQKLNLPMAYVRDKPKGHGKQNQIEGPLKVGAKVVLIEDLISTGGSSLKAAQAVDEAGGKAQAVLAIFTYEFAAADAAFREAGVELRTLSNYTALLDVARRLGTINDSELGLLTSWRNNPKDYGIK